MTSTHTHTTGADPVSAGRVGITAAQAPSLARAKAEVSCWVSRWEDRDNMDFVEVARLVEDFPVDGVRTLLTRAQV